jgi:sporulation protein YlmC with PRC-barrel domain
MPNLKPPRVWGAMALMTFFALSAAAQQAPTPEPSPPAEKPPMAKPEPAPQTAPTPSPQKATPPAASQVKSTHPLMGRTVMSSDGSNLGDVRAVRVTPDGKVMALRIKSGGFLGFGGKIVEIPEGKFTQKGDTVQLSLTTEEVSKLPAVKDAS